MALPPSTRGSATPRKEGDPESEWGMREEQTFFRTIHRQKQRRR